MTEERKAAILAVSVPRAECDAAAPGISGRCRRPGGLGPSDVLHARKGGDRVDDYRYGLEKVASS